MTNLPTPFRCMLACNPPSDLSSLPYGNFYATAKADGVRGFTHPTLGACNRSNKPIPNRALRAALSTPELVGLDYEIIYGEANAPDSFSASTSAVMTEAGPAEGFILHVFDTFGTDTLPYKYRLSNITYYCTQLSIPGIRVVVPRAELITSESQLTSFEDAVVGSEGYEGLVLRHAAKPYKFGRSTLREFGMVRLCREATAEATIVGYEEQLENCNELTLNERGYAQRSSEAAGLFPTGRLGAFVCRAEGFSETFRVGTGEGLTLALREKLWGERSSLPGRLIKFRYKPAGTQDRPRQPIWLGFRDSRDL